MVDGRPGVAPQTAKREWFARLIARGVSNAEACRIVGVNPRTGKRWRLGRTGEDDSLRLGLGADPAPVTAQLTPGSRLLLHTDGILETRDADGRFVELSQLLTSLGSGKLDTVLETILTRLRSAAGGALADDLALLVAEHDPIG